jgi:hypothetical protein
MSAGFSSKAAFDFLLCYKGAENYYPLRSSAPERKEFCLLLCFFFYFLWIDNEPLKGKKIFERFQEETFIASDHATISSFFPKKLKSSARPGGGSGAVIKYEHN